MSDPANENANGKPHRLQRRSSLDIVASAATAAVNAIRKNSVSLMNETRDRFSTSQKSPTNKRTSRRDWEHKLSVSCRACGGRRCKRCGVEAGLAYGLGPIKGLHCNWIAYDNSILGMMRPSTKIIQDSALIEQFKAQNIGAVLNLTLPGEHPHCGEPLERSGFPYDPEDFMRAGIAFYNFGWMDMTVPSLSLALDAVKVVANHIEVRKERVAIHCHAGFGRTGLIAACSQIFVHKLKPAVAIEEVRKRRPRSIQTKLQQQFVHEFGEHLGSKNLVFAKTNISRFQLQDCIEKQRRWMHGADSLIFYDIPKVLALVIRRILRDLERDPEKVASAFLEVKFEKNLNELFSSDESSGGEEQQRQQQQQHHERDPLDVLTDELKTKLNAADWTVLSPERDNDFPIYVIVKVFLDWLLHLGHPVLEVIWFLRPVALPAAAGATSSVEAADKKTMGRQSDASNYSTASSVDSSSPKLRELKAPNGESQTSEGAAVASSSSVPMGLGHDKQGRALSSPSLLNVQDGVASSRPLANASAPVLRKSSMSELPTGISAQNEGVETLKTMAKTGTVRAVAHLLRAIRAKCDGGKAFVVTSKIVMALVHERFNISENVVKTIETWLLNVREGHLRFLTEEYSFAAEVTFAKPEDQLIPFVETPLMEDDSKGSGFDGSDDEGGEEAPGGEMTKTEEGTEGSGPSNREEALLTVDVKPANAGEPRASGESPKAALRDAFKLPVVNSRVPADIASGANTTAAPSPSSQVVSPSSQASGVLPSPRSGRSPAKSSVKNRGPDNAGEKSSPNKPSLLVAGDGATLSSSSSSSGSPSKGLLTPRSAKRIQETEKKAEEILTPSPVAVLPAIMSAKTGAEMSE